MLRRWYVVLAVVLATLAVTAYFARDDGLFFTRTVVTFTSPGEEELFEEGGSREAGIIAFAASVASEINDGVEPPRYASADAPYWGAGVRQGFVIGLPDTGGQWSVSRQRAAVEMQIVSPDRAWVEAQQADLLARMEAITATQQQALTAGLDPWIEMSVDPLSATIDRVAPSRTAWVLAGLAMAAVALLVAGWAAVGWDRMEAAMLRRRRRAVADGPAREVVA